MGEKGTVRLPRIRPEWYFRGFLAFLILPSLLYPLLRGQLDTQNRENRVLAKPPVFTPENYANIPAQAEAYYNDHLPFKNQLVRVHSFLESRINAYPSTLEMIEGTQTVTRGKDGWLFYTVRTPEENSVEDYLGTNRYTPEELELLAVKYERFATYLSGYGGEAVLFGPPNKENVYPEYMPKQLKQGKDANRLDEALAFLAEHTPVTVIAPKAALLSEESGYPLYYKYDTHWNRLGAFVGCQEIVKRLKGEGKAHRLSDQTVVTWGNKEGDLSRLLGITGEDAEEPEYAVADYKPQVSVTVTPLEGKGGAYEEYVSNASDQRSVLLLRDSFGAAMLDYLPKDFARVWVTESEEAAAELIRVQKPDVVLLEIVERRAECLENVTERLMKEADAETAE